MSRAQLRTGVGQLVAFEGVYFLLSGVWPLVHLDSFLAVTGPKVDLWLVQTVGALIALIAVTGGVLLMATVSGRVTWEVALLGAGMAAALGTVDVVFVTRGVIASVYLADAAVEGVFVVWWVIAALRGRET